MATMKRRVDRLLSSQTAVGGRRPGADFRSAGTTARFRLIGDVHRNNLGGDSAPRAAAGKRPRVAIGAVADSSSGSASARFPSYTAITLRCIIGKN